MKEIEPMSPEEAARRRRKSIAIGVALGLVVLLFYITTFVRLSQNVAG